MNLETESDIYENVYLPPIDFIYSLTNLSQLVNRRRNKKWDAIRLVLLNKIISSN